MLSFSARSANALVLMALLLTGCGSTQPESTSAPTLKNESSTALPNETISLIPVSDIAGIAPTQVFTFVCELVEQRPELVSTTCADLGEGVFDIKWDTWTADGATGLGVYSVNTCEPSCAEGERLEATVTVSMDNLVTDGESYYLTSFSYFATSGFPAGYPPQATWDLTEFYLMMNN